MELVKHLGTTDPEEAAKKLEEMGYGGIYPWRDPAGAFYDWHTHPHDEVRLVLEGEITIETEEGRYRLRAGDLMFVPAGTRHRAFVGKEGVVYLCATKVADGGK
jgi:mannose-6-phosphate isomerase-like protein (cupin superfamily)